MIDLKSGYWAGTAESFQFALEANAKAMEAAIGEDFQAESLLTVDGSVGVVHIHGPLIDGNAGFLSMFGVTGYNDIREALVEAVSSPKVKTIMLDVNSGGGQVAGVDDLSAFIKQVSAIKPVTTFADGMMASAAYWLGSAGSHITSSQTAVVGSIGVLTRHTEYSQADAKDGVKTTIIRAGKYKALANSIEPLSAEARAEIQSQVNDIYDIFIGRVADNRGTSTVVADTQMGQGREFLGKRALTAGLVDDIGTYESALAKARAMAGLIEQSNPGGKAGSKQEGQTQMKKKATLNEQQLAAVASGASVEAVLQAAQEAAAAALEAAEAGPGDESEEQPAEAPAEDAPEQPDAAADRPDLVAYLKSDIASKDAALIDAKVKISQLEASITEMKATHEGLLAIARDSVGKMKVALGGSSEAAAAMSASEILAAHSEVSTVFKSKFKVGGVAATAPTAEEEREAAPVVNPVFAALVQAAKQAK